jgi:GntR family galactonate operon transcriptional repressor
VSAYPGRGIHGEVVREFGLEIIRGDHPPGSTIDPAELAARFQVSATVVREMLRVMKAKGLVDSRPRSGTFVRSRKDWNLLDGDVMQWRREARHDDDMLLADLAELRDIIEPASARLAALRRTDEDIEDLQAALDAMAAAGRNRDALMAADVRFHLLLLRASHNELLEHMDVLIIHAVRARDRILHQHGRRWTDPMPEHRRVFDAVNDRDGQASFDAMEILLRGSHTDLRSGEPPFTRNEDART